MRLEVSHCERLRQVGACMRLAEAFSGHLSQQPSKGPGGFKVVQAGGLYAMEKDKPVKVG